MSNRFRNIGQLVGVVKSGDCIGKRRKWDSADGELLSLFLDKSGRANGTYSDSEGYLVACVDANGEL